MAEGNTRVVTPLCLAVRIHVFLCPQCRQRWNRRTRQVVVATIGGGLLSVVAATFLLILSVRSHATGFEIGAGIACFTGMAALFALPIIHVFATPLLVMPGSGGVWAKNVWIRFPNSDYVQLIERNSN
jgi:hypothetical protein